MEDQYGIADLRQYITGKPFFQSISQPPDLLSCHRGLTSPHPYDMLMFRSDSTIITPTGNIGAAVAPSISVTGGGGLSGFEVEPGRLIGGGGSGGDGGAARWPRQETLTLLEIRSRLDAKFKEANHKGPLWDEISRIMSEEYGYQRSGKKCREKFENLYKYYKKTRDGKAGRQDGKHYRFFRQLEALYGETSNTSSVSETHFNGGKFHYNFPNNKISSANNQELYPGSKLSDTSLISVPNSSDYDTTSSDCSDSNVGGDPDDARNKKRRGKRSLKAKIRESVDEQMRKLMEKQEAWMQKMMESIEHKEKERLLREEQWRKQDAARIDREHKLWASERAWIEARDIALMDAFQKLTGKELRISAPEELIIRNLTENRDDRRGDIWPENEITRLIQLRNGMDSKFQQDGISEEVLWDEIATKMACYGHERSGLMCKEKWDAVNNYLLKCNKKRKENSKSCIIYQNDHESISHQGVAGNDHTIRLNDHGNSPRNINSGNAMNDSCFRYFIGDFGRL